MVTVGVLALQGAVREHVAVLRGLGAAAVEVRRPADLDGVDGLILPGGESTTISMLIDSAGLREPLAERLGAGMPTLGTCAGMILLASEVADGRPDQRCFAAIDIGVRRNAFGRQVDSFETDLAVDGLGDPFHAVFIRAPVVERVGPGVEVLATVGRVSGGGVSGGSVSGGSVSGGGVSGGSDGCAPVLCRQGPVTVAAFHPELSGDPRLHEQFLSVVAGGCAAAAGGGQDGRTKKKG